MNYREYYAKVYEEEKCHKYIMIKYNSLIYRKYKYKKFQIQIIDILIWTDDSEDFKNSTYLNVENKI